MSTLDGLIIIILTAFIVRGLWVGFVRQLASILSLVLGFIVAGRYYGDYAYLLSPYIKNQQLGFFFTYLILFFIVFCGIILSGFILKKVMSVSLLGWFDKSLGAIFGAGTGACVSCLVFMGIGIFISGSSPFFTRSVLYPYLDQASQVILTIVKDSELREELLPQPPAISEFFSDTVKPGQPPGGDTK